MLVFPVETPAVANGQEKFPDIELTEDSEIWGVIAGVVRRSKLE